MMAKNNPAFDRITMLILFCYPVLLLTVNRGMSTLFFLMLLVSLFYLFRAPEIWTKDHWDKYTIALAVAMASSVVAILLSQTYHGSFNAPPYDSPSRFLFAALIYLALRESRISTLAVVQYAFPLGAISGLLMIVFFPHHYIFEPSRLTNYFLHPIHFGNLSLMLALLSLFSINWTTRDTPSVLILKYTGLLAGLIASIQTGTRGGWVAIPVIAVAWYFFQNRKHGVIRTLLLIASISLAILAAYFLVDSIHHRIYKIYSDLAAFSHGKEDTSIGMRLQLWRAALHLFMENPIFGVGPHGYAAALPALHQAGIISSTAVTIGATEIDNYYLASMARLGIFGLLSSIAIFIVPFGIFIKTMKSESENRKKAAMMGICLVAGFSVFTLTADMFDIKLVAAFYGLTVAVFLAAATNRSTN